MDIEDAIIALKNIKLDNEIKAGIIQRNSSNFQIRWSNKDLKEMASIARRCANDNKAIDVILNELNKK